MYLNHPSYSFHLAKLEGVTRLPSEFIWLYMRIQFVDHQSQNRLVFGKIDFHYAGEVTHPNRGVQADEDIIDSVAIIEEHSMMDFKKKVFAVRLKFCEGERIPTACVHV